MWRSMAAASSSCQGRYHVFLNFRGKDTRNSFTAHLYEALCSKGIRTFIDAGKIVKGEEISTALVTAIDRSMFCIVVLSKNYASSPWCLDELVQILRCKNAKKQTVLPIFYNVNPSDVRELKGSFAEAFVTLAEKFEMERVQTWMDALTTVANISGWDARDRHEPTLIKEIVQYISDALINRSSKDANATVRVDSHLQVEERIPSPGERSDFPLSSKRKINQVQGTEIRESRDAKAMEPDISTSLTIRERSEVPLTSKRRTDQREDSPISAYMKYLSSSGLLSSPPISPPNSSRSSLFREDSPISAYMSLSSPWLSSSSPISPPNSPHISPFPDFFGSVWPDF